MLKLFYPDEYVVSAYVINYEKLYQAGYRGIIYDIDNTLVPHGAPSDERSRQLLQKLKEIGFGVMLLSNNNEKRVRMFNEDVAVKYICRAGKPLKKNYREAMKQLGTGSSNTIFIGDQLFTDIMGAKKTGMKAVLVQPIHPKEEIQIILKRYLEKVVLKNYLKTCGTLKSEL